MCHTLPPRAAGAHVGDFKQLITRRSLMQRPCMTGRQLHQAANTGFHKRILRAPSNHNQLTPADRCTTRHAAACLQAVTKPMPRLANASLTGSFLAPAGHPALDDGDHLRAISSPLLNTIAA
eukprot:NODE_1135_length_1233_cov_274.249576.p3 GENE.NODE_1135_length_1233_cov_274.249576~~NODE_1135_length_1233_cov_274.249576.p3  ORF type:complete len:122 (-),score=3.70 NODE_1135_length_1233_cov_274.249576:239-604(-)